MNKKTISVYFVTLLISIVVLSVSADIDLNKNQNQQNIYTLLTKNNDLIYPQDFEIYATSGSFVPWADIFRLEIKPDGSVIYSIEYAQDKHEGTGKWTKISDFVFTENEMNEIWSEVQANDFFSLNNYYSEDALDGTFAYVRITANGINHSVETENIPVPGLDKIVKTINSLTPSNYDLFYNAILFNIKPAKPLTPSGEDSGKQKIKYTYSTSSTDPNEDVIYYFFNWGDGTDSGWIGPYNSSGTASVKHSWISKGYYNITVKAKDDPNGDGDLSDGEESLWSDPLAVSMPKNRLQASFLLDSFFENLMSRFYLLKHMLCDNYHNNIVSEAVFKILNQEDVDIFFAGNSGTYVTIKDCDITVEIRIQISGEGATDDLAKDIEKDIEDVWNKGDWKIKCKEDCVPRDPGCPVKFDANVSKLKPGQKPDPGSHQIEVKNDTTGKGISSVKKPLPTPNGASPGKGTWDNNEPAHTWAHEAGHLMGLGDCYKVLSRDPYRTEPKPNCRGNIMGTLSGGPSQNNVSKIVADGGVECPCKCCPAKNDTQAPVNKITTPSNGGKVSSPVIIVGYADDGDDGSGVAILDFKLTWATGSYDGGEYPIDPPSEYVEYELGPIFLEYYIDPGDWITITTYAIDAAGNIGEDSVTVTLEEEQEDNTPPVSVKTIGQPNEDGGYIIWPFTPITLTATDSESGVNYIYYEVWWDSNGDEIIDNKMGSEKVYEDSLMFSVDMWGILHGLIELRWYAVDNAGNTEIIHSQQHYVTS